MQLIMISFIKSTIKFSWISGQIGVITGIDLIKSHHLAPEWAAAANTLAQENSQVKMAKIDCAIPPNHEVCGKYTIRGYPSLFLF